MHHFFVEPCNINEHTVIITGTDVNHIKNVLRMKAEEKILVSDGNGKDYYCAIESLTDEQISAKILDENYEGTELSCEFYLFQGLPKSDKMEMIIQKSVELGVKEIIPVSTKRCVVKLDEKKKESKLKRYNGIAQSAAKQSRRSIVPEVKNVMKFEEALNYAQDFDINIIPYENFKDIKSTNEVIEKLKQGMKVGIFIGPEGGFEESEVELAMDKGIRPISLGKRILRTETAPLAVLSILMFKCENLEGEQ